MSPSHPYETFWELITLNVWHCDRYSPPQLLPSTSSHIFRFPYRLQDFILQITFFRLLVIIRFNTFKVIKYANSYEKFSVSQIWLAVANWQCTRHIQMLCIWGCLSTFAILHQRSKLYCISPIEWCKILYSK